MFKKAKRRRGHIEVKTVTPKANKICKKMTKKIQIHFNIKINKLTY